jgi:hypothetical protein
MLSDLGFLRLSLFLTRNFKLGTRNRAFPSFTSSELPAIERIQNRRPFPNKIPLKTGTKTEPIATEEITN